MFSQEGYQALTTGAGLVVRTDLGVLRVSGNDRALWLQGLLTNDVQALRPGQTCYAAYLTPQGRMITDMRVVSLDDAMLLDVPLPLAASLRERLDGLIFAEDVQVTDKSPSVTVIELRGPKSEATLPDSVRRAEAVMHPSAAAAQRNPLVSVEPFVWTLHAPREEVTAIVLAFANRGVHQVSLETLDVVRIEAGTPKFLVDMDENTIPLEAGIEDRAISFTKGCYVGQELIVRVMQRGGGRVARRLIGLSLEGDAAAGDRILSGTHDVGMVTSATGSPALGQTIALGYVRRDFVEPGTALEIVSAERRIPATVKALPFLRRPA